MCIGTSEGVKSILEERGDTYRLTRPYAALAPHLDLLRRPRYLKLRRRAHS